MRYIKAQSVLPEEIIKLVQEYVDGDYLYIPRKSGNKKAWGEKNGSRSSLEERNVEIYRKYIDGSSVRDIADQYYLSEHSIRRIINQVAASRTNSVQNHF